MLTQLETPLSASWRRESNPRNVPAVKGALRVGWNLPGQQSMQARSAWAWGRVCLRSGS